MNLVSDQYRDVLRQTHKAQDGRWGRYGASHLHDITKYKNDLGAQSVLDYGCGTGTLAKAAPFPVQEYDPGIDGKDGAPEPADLIVATDVLEHIEPDRVDAVLAHIHSLCRKGVFFIIATVPSRVTMTDGRNAHLSLHDRKWWIGKLRAVGFKIARVEKRKGIFIWASRKE